MRARIRAASSSPWPASACRTPSQIWASGPRCVPNTERNASSPWSQVRLRGLDQPIGEQGERGAGREMQPDLAEDGGADPSGSPCGRPGTRVVRSRRMTIGERWPTPATVTHSSARSITAYTQVAIGANTVFRSIPAVRSSRRSITGSPMSRPRCSASVVRRFSVRDGRRRLAEGNSRGVAEVTLP